LTGRRAKKPSLTTGGAIAANRTEIMFGRLKDWNRVTARDGSCAKAFLSAVALGATILFWLRRSNRQ
jgi:hypothetical protein